MELITEVYFGWKPLAHGPGCPNPVWDDVQVLHSEGIRPGSYGADHHACTHPDCGHANTFDRVQLRLLCRDCQTVTTISGESLAQVISHPAATGWGQPPAELAGVWLWPGRPAIEGGEPHQYVVTRQAQAVTPDLLYGIITAYRDSEGNRRWIAGAIPDKHGAHQISTLRWRHSSNGLTDLAAAAAWIANTELRAQRPLVVAV
ncbi:hypothetical protein [Streptomyces sp. NBC_00582]|uniref:hypothetical protein n=1 Tax=Streptomyces sp. NBC_00582 TaxID=2975783 RepID=UPI002E803D39|nr:hypothetical protein [Streptomyces sp. NBC_00582]WUB64474.1 hypothetical protein OG852_30800 [Streptomyces sp. NBC_00582]